MSNLKPDLILGLTAYVILHCLESTSLLLKTLIEDHGLPNTVQLRKKLRDRVRLEEEKGLEYAQIAYGKDSPGKAISMSPGILPPSVSNDRAAQSEPTAPSDTLVRLQIDG